jgi:chemotaxis protein CheD
MSRKVAEPARSRFSKWVRPFLFRHSVSPFEQELITIHPGEYFATRDDTIISTVLGSCIAVGLFDEEAGIGGLNHFMLPGDSAKLDLIRSPNAKYGMYAMDLLINDIMKLGARRDALKAKVFGGGSVLQLAVGTGSRIPANNIEFAFEYLEKERIPLLASDVGGREPRKIFFFARTGKVLLKRIAGQTAALAEKDEERYLNDLRIRKTEGTITLFDTDRKGK